MRKKIGIAAAIILLAALCGAVYLYDNLENYIPVNLVPPASYWVKEGKPLREQTVLVEIAKRVFSIPQMYIDSKLPLDGRIKDSVLLEVIWPDMRSIYELKDRQEYERIRKDEQRLGWIHAETASLNPSLDSMIENNNATHSKTELVGNSSGLEAYRWYHGTAENLILSDEVFLQRDRDGHVISYIRCDPSDHGIPQCDHKFSNEGILYNLSYTRGSFFSEWREQEHRATEFLRSFELENNGQH